MPRPLQTALWRVYREGQEKDKKPSLIYCIVQQRLVLHLAELEGRTDAAEAVRVNLLRLCERADARWSTLTPQDALVHLDRLLGYRK